MISDLTSNPWPRDRSVITIGAYDGVHQGHRSVISEVRRLAADLDARSVVVTFSRHPASVVRPESAPKLLTTLAQKLQLLAETGVDAAVVVDFDEQRANESAADFVESVVVGCLRTRLVVVGEDFHFGHGRGGNVALLRQIGATHDFEVEPLRLVGAEASASEPVSSTRIRKMVLAGDVTAAAVLLGRPYELRGMVVSGDRRGRLIGFPTANVEVPSEMCLPADGVYAAWYDCPDGSSHPCAVNLGRRPTFYEGSATSLLEAHLLDFDGDLYGEEAAVRFIRRLRSERKFDGIDALAVQLNIDIADARAALRPSAAAPT